MIRKERSPAQLDKEEILHKIWKETKADIEKVYQMISLVQGDKKRHP